MARFGIPRLSMCHSPREQPVIIVAENSPGTIYSSAGYADLKNINENPQENKDIAYAVKAGQTYEVLYLLL